TTALGALGARARRSTFRRPVFPARLRNGRKATPSRRDPLACASVTASSRAGYEVLEGPLVASWGFGQREDPPAGYRTDDARASPEDRRSVNGCSAPDSRWHHRRARRDRRTVVPVRPRQEQRDPDRRRVDAARPDVPVQQRRDQVRGAPGAADQVEAREG